MSTSSLVNLFTSLTFVLSNTKNKVYCTRNLWAHILWIHSWRWSCMCARARVCICVCIHHMHWHKQTPTQSLSPQALFNPLIGQSTTVTHSFSCLLINSFTHMWHAHALCNSPPVTLPTPYLPQTYPHPPNPPCPHIQPHSTTLLSLSLSYISSSSWHAHTWPLHTHIHSHYWFYAN